MEDDLNGRLNQWKIRHGKSSNPSVDASIIYLKVNLNGREPPCKRTSIEDNLNGRQPQWKTTSLEDKLNGRQPQWKTTSTEDNLIVR